MTSKDKFFMVFSTVFPVKQLTYVLSFVLGVYIFDGWLVLSFLILSFICDFIGASVIKAKHPYFKKDLKEILINEAFRTCDITKDSIHYTFEEYCGKIEHWFINLEADMVITMMVPKNDFVIIARKKGQIFPLASFDPLKYYYSDAGTREIYYSDINFVEIYNNVIKLNTSGGHTIEYRDSSGTANEAVSYLRQKLRESKRN